MDIVKHIINILKEKETVVVPALGSFTLTTVSATIHPVDHVFTPPSKIIVFESIASQNDVLAQYIAGQEQITTAQAANEISVFTDTILKGIQQEKHFNIEGFGSFELNEEQIIGFTADTKVFADEFIGFYEFTSPAIVRTEFKDKAAQIALQENNKKAKRKRRKKILIIVFSILFLLASSAILYIFSDNIKAFLVKDKINNLPDTVSQDSATINVKADTTNLIQKDTANAQMHDDTTQNSAINTSDANYFIVAASFKSEENANKSVEKLKARGFNAAGITRQEGNTMFIVYYQSFAGKEEAYKALQQIIKTENAESWLMKK